MSNNLEIKNSNTHGKGVFSKKNFKRGDLVFILKGKVVNWSVTNQKESLYGPNWIGLTKHKWLDVSSPGVYLNHSCNPNCGIKGRVKIVALKDVKAGEELTIDYSITEMDRLWYMNCNCREKSCRKKIMSIQFLPKKIYNKYHPYTPTYFSKVYERSNKSR